VGVRRLGLGWSVLLGSAFALGAYACGLDVDNGSNEPVTKSAPTDAAPTDADKTDAGDQEEASTLDASADGRAPLTGWCATQPNAFLCDDFDHGGGLNARWDGVQTSNGNSVATSQAQSKTAPSSMLVTSFDSPDGSTSCDKAAAFKIFSLDFEEATLGFDIFPVSAGSSVAGTLFLADGRTFYQVEVSVGTESFIQEGTPGAPMEVTASGFDGTLPIGAWTRVEIRYARTPAPGKIVVTYDGVVKHEKAMRSASFSTNHRLYVGDYCAKLARSFHIDNVAFAKVR